MLTATQLDRMLRKLERFEKTLDGMLFEKVGELDNVSAFRTEKQHHSIPDAKNFKGIKSGYKWGSESEYCWFKCDYTVPRNLAGKDLFLRPHIGGYEAMLWVDGVPFGTFCTKIVFTGHGNHYCDLFIKDAKANKKTDIAIEYYAGHSYKGCAPLENQPLLTYDFTFEGIDVCVKNYEIQQALFDLQALRQLVDVLPDFSFRRGEIINTLYKVHSILYYSPDDVDRNTFMAALNEADTLLRKELSVKNGPEAPSAGLIGHSHMDTAWLWHTGETIKKCARTYANQTALMQQYPEYKFVQSSACHSDMVREHYPELFKRIQKLVAEGRYEPNGGVWVECDCNITSGESMVRQFLWGQRFTRKYFNFTSNCFWLPDTFGYSAAIPQIMKGCGVDYFLTTKIGWNDTNKFPYDTFYWQGIDGTKVFTHFNRTHLVPDVEDIYQAVVQNPNGDNVREKSVCDTRLISYGYGDGGGGPQFEMIEASRRAKDLNGCPKAEYTLVGDFMKKLEKSAVNPNTYKGELYLELHRGTLTNQHQIKRNNRKAELSLRNLELLTVADAVKNGKTASGAAIEPLYRLMLINQFHDILPGTCIPRAHKESKEQTGHIISESAALSSALLGKAKNSKSVTLTNTLSFDRSDPVIIECKKGLIVEGDYAQQRYTDLDGKEKLIITGVTIPAFSSVTLRLVSGEPSADCAFKASKDALTTPFAKVKFDKKGFISSFIDTCVNRQLCGEGYAFNTFITAEDLPSAWDNWDVDADIECKYADRSQLLSREVVSCGSAAYVIRSKYQVTAKSTVTQDMMFFANTAEVRFDTIMDWQDDHRFMKAAFDTSVMQDFARFEVQFGYVKRPTTRNDSVEKAKFEVLNHKYTDLSENRYGVALLNDCKYGISAEGGKLRLSLHKGGTRPDFTGDHGLHRCVYSFLPHNSGFSAQSVIKPAYELNIPVLESNAGYDAPALVVPGADNIIVETVKPCEDCEKAFIVRLYEAEGTYTNCPLALFDAAKKVEVTNMLEETQKDITNKKGIDLTFNPFEIKTLKISY
ncbi:MAG: alpha-mannosidase [Clostridiales bacterium]|nr:alpha-mannosidase [Clostridiales bacterium]